MLLREVELRVVWGEGGGGGGGGGAGETDAPRTNTIFDQSRRYRRPADVHEITFDAPSQRQFATYLPRSTGRATNTTSN